MPPRLRARGGVIGPQAMECGWAQRWWAGGRAGGRAGCGPLKVVQICSTRRTRLGSASDLSSSRTLLTGLGRGRSDRLSKLQIQHHLPGARWPGLPLGSDAGTAGRQHPARRRVDTGTGTVASPPVLGRHHHHHHHIRPAFVRLAVCDGPELRGSVCDWLAYVAHRDNLTSLGFCRHVWGRSPRTRRRHASTFPPTPFDLEAHYRTTFALVFIGTRIRPRS